MKYLFTKKEFPKLPVYPQPDEEDGHLEIPLEDLTALITTATPTTPTITTTSTPSVEATSSLSPTTTTTTTTTATSTTNTDATDLIETDGKHLFLSSFDEFLKLKWDGKVWKHFR